MPKAKSVKPEFGPTVERLSNAGNKIVINIRNKRNGFCIVYEILFSCQAQVLIRYLDITSSFVLIAIKFETSVCACAQ